MKCLHLLGRINLGCSNNNQMSKKRYDNDFKLMLVELFNSGRSASQLSEEYGVHESGIRKWSRELKANGSFDTKKQVSAEHQEIKELRKQLKEAELERDILKKAVSIFSKSGR